MPRVTREIAMQLVPFIKSVNFTFDLSDKAARSGYEFVKQLYTSKVLKVNPNLQAAITQTPKSPPTLSATFLDGSTFNLNTSQSTLSDIRSIIFEKAQDAEDMLEDSGKADDKKDAKGGAKGGKK
jgi:hypothetical protein